LNLFKSSFQRKKWFIVKNGLEKGHMQKHTPPLSAATLTSSRLPHRRRVSLPPSSLALVVAGREHAGGCWAALPAA